MFFFRIKTSCKIISCISILLLFSSLCFAANPSLEPVLRKFPLGDFSFQGTVFDAQTELPISGALLKAKIINYPFPDVSTNSDSKGRFTLALRFRRIFHPEASFDVQISCSKDGYIPKDNLRFRLPLSRKSYPLNIYLSPKEKRVPPDKIPPQGKIYINSNESDTDSLLVNLKLFARDDFLDPRINPALRRTRGDFLKFSSGLDKMCFSNDNLDWSAPEPYNTTKAWLLSDGDGIKTVYVKFSDKTGNWSRAFSDTIILNSSGTPVGPDGGEVISDDGKVKLIVPKDALTKTTRISLTNLNNTKYRPLIPQDTILLNIVECKPYGLIFNKPVEIIYTLDSAQIPGTPVKLGVYDSGKISFTSDPGIVPADGYNLSFNIWHFSTYAALRDFVSQGAPIGTGVKIPLPDLLTGAFSHSVALTVPPGRKGLQPALSLNYRSSNSNSWTGVGFSLNSGYIVRSTRLGPAKYIDNQDIFYLITDAGTTELVNLVDNLYQAKVESGFTKYYKEADDSWRIVSKDGSILRFGQDADSKEISSFGTFAWYLTKAIDTNGNYVKYNYTKDQGKPYLSRVDYTGNENGLSPANRVEFFLESRSDISSSYISGAKAIIAKRLQEIEVKANNDLVWRYVLEYAYSPNTNRSLLKSVTQYGSDGKSLPVQNFSYQNAK